MGLGFVAGAVSYLGWRQSAPGVAVTGTLPRMLGRTTSVELEAVAARGRVTAVEIRVVQGGRALPLGHYAGPPVARAALRLTLESAAAALREGSATLEVWARDDFWRPLGYPSGPAARVPVTVDLTPPRLEVLAATPYVAPGGAGLVALRVDGATRVETRVGPFAFPTFPLGPGSTRVGFFALPWDAEPSVALGVAAVDEAGNRVFRPLATTVLPRRFRRDVIELTEAFLQAKVPELLPAGGGPASLLERFLVINRDLRRQAEDTKRQLATRTHDRPLWEGAFLQPRNTQVFSNFAETRTYRYRGQEVDTQVHFGYDLASTQQAPVPAANRGVVVFAGPLTIYGNTVVVDHGLGLMTLYGHLSHIAIRVGEAVERGQELGRTGTTGLATGDHLHFEVLVHGVSVTPVEWWDPKWLRDRILGPLAAAGLPDLLRPATSEASGRQGR